MVKELNGLEVQGFIKERQLKQVRNLLQTHKIKPRLLIIKSPSSSNVINTYVRMKQRYANDILIEVDVEDIKDTDMVERINKANIDIRYQGIIVQLPLIQPEFTEVVCNTIIPEKDVDGLGIESPYPSATAHAIDWLLAAYNIELQSKKIAIVGLGKLVGAPLSKMWLNRGLQISMLDENSKDSHKILLDSDIIVTATGVPRLVKTADIKPGTVIVDAGTTSENGKLVGDVDDLVRQRQDIAITPVRGGVGPLTIAVLFDHLIEACLKLANKLPS